VAIARRVLEVAVRAGASRAELSASAGFDPGAHKTPIGKVALETMFALWEAAMLRLRDPGFPIAVAENYGPDTYGVLLLAAVTSRNVQEALDKMIRFYRLWTDGVSSWWEIECQDTCYRITFVQVGDLTLGRRCEQEFSIAELTSALREATGKRDWAPLEVHFRHAAPRSLRRHEEFFGAPLRFETARAALVLRPGDFAMPMRRADRIVAAFFERHAGELLQKLTDAPESILQVKQVIAELLREGLPRLADVAHKLGVGARTLRRRLADQGQSYKALLDQTRSELAQQYVEQPRYSIYEISHLLAFSEPSAFYRAFRRWTRESPMRFRERTRRT
jgi:AraC-like DNA-binding protein